MNRRSSPTNGGSLASPRASTETERATLDAVVREWGEHVRSTARADRRAVEEALLGLCEDARLAAPSEILWVESPKAAAAHGPSDRAPVDPLPRWFRQVEGPPSSDAPEMVVPVWSALARPLRTRSLIEGLEATLEGAGLPRWTSVTRWDIEHVIEDYLVRLLPPALQALPARIALARGVHGAWLVEGRAILLDRPTVLRLDDDGAPHAEGGPAIEYADGERIHAWRGRPIAEDLALDPTKLTRGRIDAEENVEVRQVLVERYGAERYLRESDAFVLDHDERFGTLYRKLMRGDEPLLFLRVTNRTPEPDGTFRDYWLRVPPSVHTARAAAAWTFGFDDPDDYDPIVET